MHQSGIRAQGLMADYKLKGILGSGDKSPNHGSSSSQSPLQSLVQLEEECLSEVDKNVEESRLDPNAYE